MRLPSKALRLAGILVVGACLAIGIAACDGGATTDGPAPTAATSPASPAPETTATPRPGEAARTPATSTSTPSPAKGPAGTYREEHLPLIMLHLKDVEAEFGRNYLIEEDYHFDDTGELFRSETGGNLNFEAAGWVTGYTRVFEHTESQASSTQSQPRYVLGVLHLLATESQASDFLYLLSRDVEGWEEVKDSTLQAIASPEIQDLGDEAAGYRFETGDSGYSSFYYVTWRRGKLVLHLLLGGAADSGVQVRRMDWDDSANLLRLARRMDERAVTALTLPLPTPAPSPTAPVPVPVPAPTAVAPLPEPTIPPTIHPAERLISLRIGTSSSANRLADLAVETFLKESRIVPFDIRGVPSDDAFRALETGQADILITEPPSQPGGQLDLPNLQGKQAFGMRIATYAATLLVNPANRFAECMTTQEIRRVFESGSPVTRWSDIRSEWPDIEVELLVRPTSAEGIHYASRFGDLRADVDIPHNASHIIDLVADLENALAISPYSEDMPDLEPGVKMVSVDAGSGCVAPTIQAIKEGSYSPLTSPLYLYVTADSLTRPEVREFAEIFIYQPLEKAEEWGYLLEPGVDIYADWASIVRNALPSTEAGPAPTAAPARPVPTQAPQPTAAPTVPPAPTPTPAQGEFARDVEFSLFPGLDYEPRFPLRLSDLRGTPVVLNFSVGYSAEGVASIRVIDRVAKSGQRPDVQFLGVELVDPDWAQALAWELALSYPLVFNLDEQVRHGFWVFDEPLTIALDRDHRIVGHQYGELTEDRLLSLLQPTSKQSPLEGSSAVLKEPILVDSLADIERYKAMGVIEGNGTDEDPYRLAGFDISVPPNGVGIRVKGIRSKFVIGPGRIEVEEGSRGKGSRGTGLHIVDSSNISASHVSVALDGVVRTRGRGVALWKSQDVTLSHIEVTNGDDGIRIEGSSGITVSDSEIRGGFDGIYIAGGGMINIHRTTVEDTEGWGIRASSSGIPLDISIGGTTVQRTGRSGIHLSANGSAELRDVEVRQAQGRAGVLVSTGMQGIEAVVSGVSLSENLVGLALYNHGPTTIESSSFSDNMVAGIAIAGVVGGDVSVFRSELVGNYGYGLWFFRNCGQTRTILRENVIGGNGLHGVFVGHEYPYTSINGWPTSVYCPGLLSVQGNDFVANGSHLTIGTISVNNTESDGLAHSDNTRVSGNYWSGANPNESYVVDARIGLLDRNVKASPGSAVVAYSRVSADSPSPPGDVGCGLAQEPMATGLRPRHVFDFRREDVIQWFIRGLWLRGTSSDIIADDMVSDSPCLLLPNVGHFSFGGNYEGPFSVTIALDLPASEIVPGFPSRQNYSPTDYNYSRTPLLSLLTVNLDWRLNIELPLVPGQSAAVGLHGSPFEGIRERPEVNIDFDRPLYLRLAVRTDDVQVSLSQDGENFEVIAAGDAPDQVNGKIDFRIRFRPLYPGGPFGLSHLALQSIVVEGVEMGD